MSSTRTNGSPSLNPPSKLPRFLQKQGSRKADAATAAAAGQPAAVRLSPAKNRARAASSSRRTRTARPRRSRPSTNHLSSSSLHHHLTSSIQCRRPPSRSPRPARARAPSAQLHLRLRHSICQTSMRARRAPAARASAISLRASAAGSRIHSLRLLPTFLSLPFSRNTHLGAEHRHLRTTPHHPRVQVHGRWQHLRRFSPSPNTVRARSTRQCDTSSILTPSLTVVRIPSGCSACATRDGRALQPTLLYSRQLSSAKSLE